MFGYRGKHKASGGYVGKRSRSSGKGKHHLTLRKALFTRVRFPVVR